jgi:hypothetical protein
MPSEYKKQAKKLLTMAKEHEKKYRKMIQLAGREKTPQNTLKTLDRAKIEKMEAQKLEFKAIQLLKKDAGNKIGKAIIKPRKIRTRFNA